jgi:cell division septal protein FtsQ
MRTFYRLIILIITITFLTTYNPGRIDFFPKNEILFLKIKSIKIINNKTISSNEIIDKLSHIYEQNILFINREDLETPLKSIHFLNKIEVKKKYPNTIIIKVYETQPVAVLYKQNNKYIIDNLSNLIPLNKNIEKNNLPNVFGFGAEKNFINFLNQLDKNNFPKNKIRNYYYFQINRWDVELLGKQIIKFPADKISDAIQQSIKLLSRKDFENYNLIDLRLHDKIVVK